MKHYLKLLRPKDWAKNTFLFIPLFFAGNFFDLPKIALLLAGFVAFSCFASSIYVVNDYRDVEDDRKHPVKCKRPIASGHVKKPAAVVLCICLLLTGTLVACLVDPTYLFLFILILYFAINLAYSFGLKNIAILDVMILSSGFVLRVKAGAIIAHVETTEWLIIMTFLLSLFMAIAKRRDDMLLKVSTGLEMRKSMSGYNLDFLDTMLGLFSAIMIVAYINYTVSPNTIERMGTYRLYYSSIFVIAAIMRYLQITFVLKKSGSPTEILYKDRFIQITILLWLASIYTLLYIKDISIFRK